jgi:uncharacterized integral membrane protein
MSQSPVGETLDTPRPPLADALPPDGSEAEAGAAPTPPAECLPVESRGAHFQRMAHRTRLHLSALAAVALLVYVVALATTNTRDVRIDWVFAHSRVPLVWLTLFSAILGWMLGILITMLFRRRTRAPLQRDI